MKHTCDYLDTIPIESYLINGMTAGDVMDAIENEYDDKLIDDPIFKGFIFSWMDEYEFMSYCVDRFDTNWYEKTEYIVNNN